MTADSRKRAVVAVHLLLIREGNVLLLRRANTGYEDGKYSVPAGHVERGETASAAMIREAREEIGVALLPGDISLALVMHRLAEETRIDFFFVADHWVGEPANREPEKCDELRWAPLEGLPNSVIPYVRYGIETFRAKETYAEFGWV